MECQGLDGGPGVGVRTFGASSLLHRGTFMVLLDLGLLLDGQVGQLVLLSIVQKLLNSDYTYGNDGIW